MDNGMSTGYHPKGPRMTVQLTVRQAPVHPAVTGPPFTWMEDKDDSQLWPHLFTFF